MTRLQQMQQKLRELMVSARELKAQAEDESREFTAEDEARLDGVLAEIETVEADIEAEKAKQVRLRGKLEVIEGRGQALGNAVRPAPARRTQVEVGRTLADDDPSRGYRSPREFLMAVIDAGRTGRMEERLRPLATAGSDEQGEYSDAYGGFLVPETFSPNLLSVGSDSDFTVGRTTQIPMATPTVRIPARTDKDHSTSVSGGFTVSRRAETLAPTASRAAFEQVTLNAHTLMGAAYATEEILTDSPISFAAIIQAGFNDEFGSRVLSEKLNGTGVGEYEGIMNCPALVSVAKEAGQAADSIVYENVIKMRAQIWGYQDAIWHANHDCYPQLAQLSGIVGTGGSLVWQPSAQEDRPDMLLGRPIYFTEYAETVGDAGDIMLVNWSQYLEGVYQGMQSAASIHVRFLNHEQCFKFWMRNDGRSWWRTAMTPKKGANSLSPYVRLAARA